MSLVLHDLYLCCRQFDNDKATERKKEIEKFKRLIRSPEAIEQLDRNSESKHPKQLNWDAVFRFLQRYIQKETECLQAANPNVSATTQANRQKKMQEIGSIMKYFIRWANKRGPRLKCQDLLKHIMDTLQNRFSCAAYGTDYSSILLKDILSVRKYWCEISQQQWSDLMNLYFKMYLRPSKDTNRVLVARIIHTLVRGCCFQSEGLTSTLFEFFAKAMQNARQEQVFAVIEHIMSALNVFLNVCVMNCRIRVCKLGEEIFPTLLCIWTQKRPQDSLKEEIIEFFRLQLHAHHPKGAKTQEKGAFAADWLKWQHLLYSLYEIIVSEVSHIGSRGKYSAGMRHVAVKDNLVDLAADICHQLFGQDTKVFVSSVTDVDSPQSHSHQGTPSKRRRIELGWEVVRDGLQKSQNDFDMIPWLQITTVLVAKYPSSVPPNEIVAILTILHQILSQQRRGERIPYVLRCLSEIAVCQRLKSTLNTAQRLDLQKLWAKIWAITLRSISSQQTEVESFWLLEAILHGSLTVPDKDFWKIFSCSTCQPSSSAVKCLSRALAKCTLPEQLDGIAEHYLITMGDRPQTLREAIMRWLLGYRPEEDIEENVELPSVVRRDFPNQLVSQILVVLSLKDCRAGMDFFHSPLAESALAGESPAEVDKGNTFFTETEHLFLQTTFDETPNYSSTVVSVKKTESVASRISVKHVLKNRLEEYLLALVECLHSAAMVPPECQVRCADLIIGVLRCYSDIGVTSEDDACTSALFQKAKSFILDAGEYISTAKNKLNEELKLNSLKTMVTVCTKCLHSHTKHWAKRSSSALFLQLFPARFMNDLVQICKQLIAHSGKSHNACEAKDDIQDGFREMQGNGSGDFFNDNDKTLEVGDYSDSSDSLVGTGAKSILAEENLTKHDFLLLDTLRFLCCCTAAGQVHVLSFRSSDIRRKLLMLIEEQDHSISKSLHLHMYLILLKELPSEECVLPSDDFSILVKPLLDLCSMYRCDQEVCSVILTHILPLLTVQGIDSDEMTDVQGKLLKTIGAFWHLSKGGKCNAQVRAALVRCMKALLEKDPHSKWTVLSIRDEEFPVSDVYTEFLRDTHHQVRMLAAMSVSRLFQEVQIQDQSVQLKALPVKLQQKAFENAYMKVQAGMRFQNSAEELQDEKCNRKATLLTVISLIMCCSPICEKQALFAICQSLKENKLDPTLVKKILETVSKCLTYRSLENFMVSHLDYLIHEWLRMADSGYNLPAFPYVLLNCSNLEEFYRSYYKILVPHLTVNGNLEEVKSIAACIKGNWKELLADCLPKIMAYILPCFAYQDKNGSDGDMAQQRENASKVFDMLKEDACLGKQQIDLLSHNSLPEIVVELLNTLYDSPDQDAGYGIELVKFSGAMDPAPNPPYFPSPVIRATLEYISSCHKEKFKSLVAILSRNPDSIQKILLAISKKAVDTSSAYEKHRILMMYRLFVNLLLKEIKDGLGGVWAFVLRDVIYSLIHHINSWPSHMDDVSTRSFSLCCDLLNVTCQTAVEHCGDALESHLHVIVGTLIPLVHEQPEIRQQALELLKYLVVTNQGNENLYNAIRRLDSFPDHPDFRELRLTQEKIKYSKRQFTLLEEINHFLSVSSCDSLPLTRLVGLNDLKQQLELHKADVKNLLKEYQDDPKSSVLVKLVVNLLQLCKSATNYPTGKDILEAAGNCLGEMGPIDFSTITLQRKKDEFHCKATELFKENKFKLVFILLSVINNALIDQCIEVRFAAATCAKNILATRSGHQFLELSKNDPSGPDPMLMYLQPFRTARRKVHESQVDNSSSPSENLDDGCLWIPQCGNHDTWLKTLTCALLDSGGVRSEVLQLIKPMCEVKTDFCQMILPYLIHDILLNDKDSSWQVLLSNHIRGFFNACCRMGSSSSRSTTPAIVDSETDSLPHGHMDKISRRTMLAVVDYLRKQKRHQLSTAWDDNFWLDLNYLEVALTAQSCAAHFTALLCAEIYADKIRSEEEELKRSSYKAARSLKFDETSQELTISSMSNKSKEETGIGLQELLIDVYRSIGEPDSLYGCGGGKMLHPLARIRTYEHEVLWDKALVTYDIEMNLPVSTRQAGIVQALQNFGLCHILTTYLKGLEAENAEWCEELQEIRFQAAWRNMQWDHVSPCRDESSGPGYHESVYHALQSLKDQEFSSFHEVIKFARVKEVEELCKGSLESVYSLYPTLCRLQILGELETIGQLLSRSATDDALNEVHRKWQQQLQLLKDSDFTFQEPILAMRTVIQEMLIKKEIDDQRKNFIKDALTEHLLQMAKLARAARNSQLAEKAIFQIKQHNPVGFGISTWQLEEAQVFWDKQEQSLSLDVLKQMIGKLEVNNNESLVPLYIECLRLCGNWLAETCLESPGTIMQKYLEKAVTLSIQHKDTVHNGKMEAFLSLARFSDAQYQSIDNYMKSSEFENKRALLKNAKEEIHLIKEHKFQTNRYVVKIQRECELDERAMCALQEDRKQFLCKAVENYINCLQSGEEHDMRIFRLCSLWLENSSVPEVNNNMKKGVEKIPSYKFLPLMYQLAARMGTKMPGGQKFHEVLNKLIERTSLDHPHHTLFIILALSNANKDDILGTPEVLKRGKHTRKDLSHLDQGRMDAASNIINTVRKSKAKMVKNMEKLCDALITLANLDATKWKMERKAIDIPSTQPITKLKDLDEVVIPTMELKVDPSGRYENIITVKSFGSQFRLAGGVNLPKIIDCVGSDGKERRQLVKGRDDLRQDAVMQQVFQMCNALLQKNADTRKRKLTIRTYKVIPLSQRSGILEWCTGTVPIGEYLVNPNEGAHKRYRPNDWSSLDCRKRMSEAQKLSFEAKYQVFMDVCKNFRPVFRYFCMEKFLDPADWFEKRLGYTRSVATSSIVCYIVGLGDRHVQNILIDEESAELVHIDLGVAFEQGKILPTPETVPFRLTRDIVDGMGITGVEGVFRRCCEKTMEVMRSYQEALLTIVEVLLYDPLFDWTMNPLKALYLQQRPEEDADFHSTLNSTIAGDETVCDGDTTDVKSINKVAERVLLRLQEKLKGVEEGAVLSVGGQVNLLIQQARDLKNLSRLFPGWQPWV
ncbi:serine-protein kinase ATM isoform X1 [Carcharodon carcharias]|uniref:serine-protein kinase ATM isoform X1 n=2 Tax=Carcharodon carcharias TaxID=13397 RepID=UPI001B7E1431|nr:serine-protein kinase ATM isoform X1 [Carcharodon carcharias]